MSRAVTIGGASPEPSEASGSVNELLAFSRWWPARSSQIQPDLSPRRPASSPSVEPEI